ncbi:hypothetical protein [Erythrobacter aureus]|nr:hypothetical protein [Erythrobacter aureus]
MPKRQLAAMIARRKAAAANKAPKNLLGACLDAAGFAEHRDY